MNGTVQPRAIEEEVIRNQFFEEMNAMPRLDITSSSLIASSPRRPIARSPRLPIAPLSFSTASLHSKHPV
jgi:hypothetical protein